VISPCPANPTNDLITTEQALADPAGEVESVVQFVKPLVKQVVAILQSTLKALVADPVGTVTDTVSGAVDTVEGVTENLTPDQLVDILKGVITVRPSHILVTIHIC
jgi:hypothetical protein